MPRSNKGLWAALAEVVLSLAPRYRVYVVVSVLFVVFLVAAGVAYRLTAGSEPALVLLWSSVVGLMVVVAAGVYIIVRAVIFSDSE